MSNAAHLRGSAWLNFQRVLCRRWHHGNRVLIGDAAHTAHFSIGSGTKLAMEDAIALVSRTAGAADVPAALAAYQEERETEALQAAERGAQPHALVRGRRALHEARALAVHLQPADRQPAHRPRQPQAARPGLRGGRRGAARGARGRRRRATADVPAVRAAWHAAREPHRRLADGAVLGEGRHAGRLAPRASRRPRDRRGGARLHRDDLRVARRPHLAGLHRDLERGAARRLAAHRRLRRTRTAARSSACSSATPAARAPPSSAGRTKTGRCRPGTGRRWRRRRCRTSRASARRRAR